MPIHVHFLSDNLTLAGHLYLPVGHQPGDRHPAVVTVSPGGGIKEQTSGRYARELSERGFVTLAFDHRSYGESEGFPRFDENAYSKIEDIKSAVGYLGRRPEVDPSRVGVMGICGGAGYSLAAAATDRRIKAVATVSGVADQRGATRGQFPDRETIVSALAAGSAARQAFADGAEPLYFPLIPDAATPNVMDLIRQAPSYYFDSERGAHPRWENKVLSWSLEHGVSFSALDVIDLITPHPVLFIAGGKSDSLHDNEAAYAAAGEPKELFVVDGARHLDLYDIDEYVKPAVDKLTEFFANGL
jgi:hypothetical protein